ncbi:MAG: hypothetical protein ACRCYU_00580 [Nocardioides sp.]
MEQSDRREVPNPNDEDLVEVNACMAEFGVAVYRDSEDRFRLYGDINRMQEVVDGKCADLISAKMSNDFLYMFRYQVDALVAECLKRKGVAVEYDPERGLNILDGDIGAEVVDECINAAYEYFRHPPH